ncbi:MAG: hypothetical protein N3D77_04300 [Geminicoccaceae bacterium]|nr:hypothetical protein [Geminicoccaceae bacterium]
MTRQLLLKTSFASGELDPLMFGRIDLRAQDDGARRLRNVFVHSGGGVSRRPGTRILAEVPGARRLLPFDDDDAAFLLVLAPERLVVLRDGNPVADLEAPWSAEQLLEIDWVRYRDRLYIVHPDVRGMEVIRRRNGPGQPDRWELRDWRFEAVEPEPGVRRPLAPFAKLAPPDTAVRVRRDGDNPPAGASAGDFVLVDARHTEGASADAVFKPEHYGVWLRIAGKYVRIVNYQAPNLVLAKAYDSFPDSAWTLQWEEEAFSHARGWPRAVSFHQDRLVIGGSRDLPDWVWMSRTGRPLNFDVGTGLDDEAIAFRLADETRHVITNLVPGRNLQIFTTSGEWIVKGFPVTPAGTQVERQTRIGSRPSPRVRPIDVDGATLFVGASGRELREFLYTEVEQAYQAADLATLSRHLLDDPIDAAFDGQRRLLWIVRRDGRIATVTIDRNANVAAWTLQEFEGSARAVATLRGKLHLLLSWAGTTVVETLEEGLWLDHASVAESESATTQWSGFGRYVGRSVAILADGAEVWRGTLGADSILLGSPARSVVVGVAYAHEIEPAPTNAASRGVALDALHRPIRSTFRLADSRRLAVDTGNGFHTIDLASPASRAFSGDRVLRAMGWRRGHDAFLWRIRDDAATSFTLLAAQTELKVNE